jgi:DNA-binding transcriptional ArsR family regulator
MPEVRSRPTGLSEDAGRRRPLSGKQRLAYAARVGDVFKALADPTRRVLLDELLLRDGQTLFELCSRLAVRHGLSSTRQAVSQHLDVLEDAGLVVTRRQGRYKFHHLDTAPLHVINERWLTGHGTDET